HPPYRKASSAVKPLLLRAPVGLRVLARRSQRLLASSVSEHSPNLVFSGAIRLKNNVTAIGRPRRKIVAPGIMCQLYPLPAGDVHYINVLRAGSPGSVLAHPGKSQELSVGRPRRRNRVTDIGDALYVGAIGSHHI